MLVTLCCCFKNWHIVPTCGVMLQRLGHKVSLEMCAELDYPRHVCSMSKLTTFGMDTTLFHSWNWSILKIIFVEARIQIISAEEKLTLDNRPAANASRNLTCKAAETAATSFSGTAKHTECSLLACTIFYSEEEPRWIMYTPKIKDISNLRDHDNISSNIFHSTKYGTWCTWNPSHSSPAMKNPRLLRQYKW